jgi:hypothetical protein
VALPDDFPDHVEKVGLAATITVHTEEAGAISMVALAVQWINASLTILVFIDLAGMPGLDTRKRNHPDAKAISLLGWPKV